jgi:hypothetical protein
MAFTTGNQNLPGYELPLGDKKLIVFDHTGPTSYTQFVPGSGVGGDVILASGSGLNFGGFDYLDADTADTTGQIQAFPVFYLGGYGNAVPQVSIRYFSLVTATLGGQAQTAGAEIVATTNLSTFSWRFRALAV